MTLTVRPVVFLFLCFVGVVLTIWNPVARTAADYNRDVAIGGTALYGTLRTVNAVMSVAKEGEVHVSIGVASGSRSPGQVLQPVTETINRTADALFGLVVVAGALSVTMAPLATLGAASLAVGSGLIALGVLAGKQLPSTLRHGSLALVRIGVLAAVILPGSYGIAFLLGDRITASAWAEASSVIDRIDATYGDVSAPVLVDEAPVIEEPSSVEIDEPERAGGIFRGGIEVFGSAIEASKGAIASTVDAASGLATTVGGAVVDNVSVVVNAMSLGSDLFRASVEIIVAYLVKLIILPFLIMLGALHVLRSMIRL